MPQHPQAQCKDLLLKTPDEFAQGDLISIEASLSKFHGFLRHSFPCLYSLPFENERGFSGMNTDSRTT